MSLLDLTKEDAECRALLNSIMPRDNISAPKPLKHPAITKHASVVGTAFDYLTRFEIEARHNAAVGGFWIAEAVAHKLRPIAKGKAPSRPSSGSGLSQPMTKKTAAQWVSLVDDARRCHAEYLAAEARGATLRSKLASHALTLARIDAYFRAGYVDANVGKVDPDDLADLLVVSEAVPWDEILSGAPVLLNPNFGVASARVGGGDADLIVGSTLFDFKVVTTPVVREDLRQLLGYLLLAQEAQRSEAGFPSIERLAIYYARHGITKSFPVEMFTKHTNFEQVSERFWAIADQRFPLKLAPKEAVKVQTKASKFNHPPQANLVSRRRAPKLDNNTKG